MNINAVLSCFLTDVNEAANPSFVVNPLVPQEIINLEASGTIPDIDCLIFWNSAKKIFNDDENIKAYDFLKLSQAELYKKCKLDNIYSKNFKNVFVFGRIGEYSIGIPNEKDYETCEIIENDAMFIKINGILNQTWERNNEIINIQYRSFREIMIESFGDLEIVLFKHGQKTSIKDIKKILVDLILAGPIEIAIGKEFQLGNQFLGVEFLNNFQKFLYSNFLSTRSFNLLCHDEISANFFMPESYRFAIYNTFQHIKKNIHYKLELSSHLINDTPNEQQRFLAIFQQAFTEKISKIASIMRLETLQRTSLRMEAYFQVESIRQLDFYIQKINKFPTEVKLTRMEPDSISALYDSALKTLRYVYSFYLVSSDFKRWIVPLYLYHRIVLGVFSLKNSRFSCGETNFNVAIKNSDFDMAYQSLNNSFFECFNYGEMKNLV